MNIYLSAILGVTRIHSHMLISFFGRKVRLHPVVAFAKSLAQGAANLADNPR